MVDVRQAVIADAEGIARVHVRSWQAGYRGLMDQSVLDALSVTDRAARWEGILRDPDPVTIGTIVAESEAGIVGWVTIGAGRDVGADAEGEVYGIYSDPASWSRGVGHALITAAEEALVAAGHRSGFLWVLEGNERADVFYARHGWTADGATKVDERPGLTLRERRLVKHLG